MDNNKSFSREVAEQVFEFIKFQNPFIENEKEKYLNILEAQYGELLTTNLISELSDEDYKIFQELLKSSPEQLDKHSIFLKEHISNFDDILIETTKNFIQQYKELKLN